jgi:FKBP-type peptidyl-prolyl cis-trans isomerase
MRALAILALVFGLAVVVSAQHKIPPLPDTAGTPKKLSSGVTITDIKVGTGVPAEKGRMVRIYFTGWVTRTQVMFDYRDERTGPLAFRLGEGTSIKGLEYGIYGMHVGGQRRVIIPPSLGHGSHPTTLVPANSQLTYDVELVSVAKPGV